jgi:hypothetical protein
MLKIYVAHLLVEEEISIEVNILPLVLLIDQDVSSSILKVCCDHGPANMSLRQAGSR